MSAMASYIGNLMQAFINLIAGVHLPFTSARALAVLIIAPLFCLLFLAASSTTNNTYAQQRADSSDMNDSSRMGAPVTVADSGLLKEMIYVKDSCGKNDSSSVPSAAKKRRILDSGGVLGPVLIALAVVLTIFFALRTRRRS
jgi:hypothetical protein